MKRILLITALFLFCINSIFPQFVPASYQHIGRSISYQIMFPENYDETKKYPLVVFLHGAGERGDDNEKQLAHGKQFLIDNFRVNYPAIVIVPQCPSNDFWANIQRHTIGNKTDFKLGLSDEPTSIMKSLMDLINTWLTSGKVDTKKVYVGGLSMGGMGTFELLWRMPTVFAAAFPICGGAATYKIPMYAKNTAVWVFHGGSDNIVPVQLSRMAYETLNELSEDAKYTEYEGVGHNSWDNVFKEKDLVPWLFSHSK